MCGRYIIDDKNDIEEMNRILAEIKKNRTAANAHHFDLMKRGEIFPQDYAPVIISAGGNKIDATVMRWGYNHPSQNGVVINARFEGIQERPMFRDSISNKRCIIPTNGFYEWHSAKGKSSKKDKYYIRLSESPMLYLAGIFDDRFNMSEGRHYVIITKPSEGVIANIHHRMPLIIPKRDILNWLNCQDKMLDEFFEIPMPELLLRNLG